MKIEVGSTVLVTTSNWFYGHDGVEYRAVFGTVKGISEDSETLGIKTNRGSTNWYVQIGRAVIAGCQINYVIGCTKCPPPMAKGWGSEGGKINEYVRPIAVYNADEPV